MKIFITGSTGFIGTNFLELLLKNLDPESSVYVLQRLILTQNDPRIHLIHADLSQIDTYQKELLDSDYVYHLAACATYGNDLPYDEINYQPTVKMLEILKTSVKIKNFIFLSTIGVLDRNKTDDCSHPLAPSADPHPHSKYGESKLKAELAIRGQNIVPYTIIRPSWVYGKNMRTNSHIYTFVTLAYKKSSILKIDFPGKVPLIHVSDLSAALLRCMNNQTVVNKIYIAVTENRSIGNIFKTIVNSMANKSFRQFPVPFIGTIVKKIHSLLPLSISNLFIDYLCAINPEFLIDFKLDKPISFNVGIQDVINDHLYKSGYWIITGANSGIGLALARLLKKERKKLILIDKNDDLLIKEFGTDLIFKCDLSLEKDIFDVAGKINAHRIFCLVNNAGTGKRGGIDSLAYEDMRKMLDVNVKAPIFMTKALLSTLVRNKSTIVNISSSIGLNPLPNMSLYSATKAALKNWSDSLMYELRKTNPVITLYPSGTNTNFQKSCNVKVMKEGKGLLKPEFVARNIYRAVLKGKAVPILSFPQKALLTVSRFLSDSGRAWLWGMLFERMR